MKGERLVVERQVIRPRTPRTGDSTLLETVSRCRARVTPDFGTPRRRQDSPGQTARHRTPLCRGQCPVRGQRHAGVVRGAGVPTCTLTWGEQKIFECDNFFCGWGVFERGGNFRDVVQSKVKAGQDMNLHNGPAITDEQIGPVTWDGWTQRKSSWPSRTVSLGILVASPSDSRGLVVSRPYGFPSG
jgi:hypothetical protein